MCGHREDAGLIGMTKSIFIISQKAIFTESFSFQVEDDIDDMFEIFGSGNITTFGDMTDDDEGRLRLFGSLMEEFTAGFDLSWCPHDAFVVTRLHRLDTIDDDDVVAFFVHGGDDIIDIRGMKTMISLIGSTA